MKCPTKEQIVKAANLHKSAKVVLEELFPEAFEMPIQPGEIYKWGTASDGGCGVVIKNDSRLDFINFCTGLPYMRFLPSTITKNQLNEQFKLLPNSMLHHCYKGEIRGPYRFKSWCIK